MISTNCTIEKKEFIPKIGYPVVDAGGIEVMNTSKTARYMRYIDTVIGKVFSDLAANQGWTISDLENDDNATQIYTAARGMMKRDLIPRLASLNDEVKADLNKILTNWDLFASYHQKYKAIVTLEEDTSLLEDEENTDEGENEDPSEGEDSELDEDDKDAEYDKTGNDQSAFEMSTQALKGIFRVLTKTKITNVDTQEVTEDVDEDGLPTSVDFQSIWNNVLTKTAGRKSEQDFIDTLKSSELFKVYPEVKQIQSILALDKKDKTQKQIIQLSEFYKVFSRPIIKLYLSKQLGKENGKLIYSYFPQLKGNEQKITSEFKTKFLTGDIPSYLQQHVVMDGDFKERRIASLPPQGDFNTEDYEGVDISSYSKDLDFLSLMGFQFSGLSLLNTGEEKRQFIEGVILPSRNLLYPNVQKRIEQGQRITNPVDQLREPYASETTPRIAPNRQIISRIIRFESVYSKIAPTLMTRNANGEAQYDISNDNAISVATYYLNLAQSLDELYQTAPFKKAKYSPIFRNSNLINFLFDQNGNKIPNRSIVLNNYNGLQPLDTKAKTTRKLTSKEKFITDFQNMLIYGQNDVMRTETSNSFYALGMQEGASTNPTYSPSSFYNDFLSNNQFVDTLNKYLDAELERIATYKKSPSSYPENYGKFSIFSEMLSPETQSKLTSNIEGAREIALNAIDDYLQRQVAEIQNKISTWKIDPKDLLTKTLIDKAGATSLDNLLRAFTANTFISNVDFSAVYSGESLFFKDMHKRLKALASTGFLASNLSDINYYLISSPENKAYLKKYGLNPRPRDNSQTLQTQVIESEISTDNAYTSPNFLPQVQKSVQIRDGQTIPLEELAQGFEKAKEIEIADGQGYITVDFHRELAFRFGFWTPEAEVAYKYEGLVHRKNNNIKIDEQELQSLEKQILQNPEKYTIPVLKLTYNGPVENDDVKVDAKGYDKFSLQPLLPSFVKNHPELASLNKRMVDKNIAYTKYKSGTKQFVRQTVSFENVGKVTPDLYSTILLKEQLKTNITQKTESIIPTQFIKLVMANLFSEGNAVTPAAKAAYEDYLKLLTEFQADQVNYLLKNLGFSYDLVDGELQLTNLDVSKISELLNKEVSRQSLSSNITKAIETAQTPDGVKFKYPLESTGVYQQISDILTGVIDKTLRRYKVNSADFILVSPARISQKLKFYQLEEGKISTAECKIALTKEFAKLLNRKHPRTGEPIGTLDELNKLLKDPKWVEENKKSLTVVFSRPPIGGQNAMGWAQINEFMPPTAGNNIMLPDEFIAKAGIDFDYDKEKVLIPTFDDNGLLLSDSTLTQIGDKIRELESQYPELYQYASDFEMEEYGTEEVDNIIKAIFSKTFPNIVVDPNTAIAEADIERYNAYEEYYNLKGQLRYEKSNKLIDNYVRILSLPEQFESLISPDSTELLKPVALQNSIDLGYIRDGFVQENGEVKLPQMGAVYNYLENLRMFRTFFDAKELLGAFASENSFQQLVATTGISLNQNFNTKFGKSQTPHTISKIFFSPEEREKIFKNNKVNISNRFNEKGILKQRLTNQYISFTVDAAKDPRFSTMNINWRNIGAVQMLSRMGLSQQTIVDIINTPIIRRYEEYLQTMKQSDALSKIFMDLGIYNSTTTDKEVEITPKNPIRKGEKPFTKDKKLYVTREVEVKNPLTTWQVYPTAARLNAQFSDEFLSSERIRELKNPPADRTADQKEKDRIDSLKLFTTFFELNLANREYRKFQTLYNYDTTKISSPFQLRNKEITKNQIVASNLLSREDLDKFEQNAIIRPFINNKVISKIFSSVFSITNTAEVSNNLSAIYSQYTSSFNSNKKGVHTLPKVLNNDFLKAVIDTFGTYNSKNINEIGHSMLIKQPKIGNLTVGERLLNLRNSPSYAQLESKFPIIKQFQVIKSETKFELDFNNVQLHSVQFVRSSTDSIQEVEDYIQQIRDIISSDFKLNNVSKDITQRIQQLVKDILFIGYYQPGFSKMYQSYQDIIPTEFLIDTYNDAIQQFHALSPAQKEKFLEDFNKKFKQNNPKFFPSKVKNTVSKVFKYYDLEKPIETVVEKITPAKEVVKPKAETAPISIPQSEVPLVTEVNRGTKKEKFFITKADGIKEEVEAYPISVKEYPDFKGFVMKTETIWIVYEATKGISVGNTGNTMKEALATLPEYLNTKYSNPKNREILESIGLFTSPKGTPLVQPTC